MTVSDIQTIGIITSQNQTVQLNTTDMGTVGVQVSGTWTGSLVPEISIDGITWTQTTLVPVPSAIPVSSISANGTWQGNCGACLYFRLKANSAITGSIAISMNATQSVSCIMFDNLTTISAQGIVGPGASGTSLNPILNGGLYYPTGYTLTTQGQLGPLVVDNLSNLKVDEQYAPAYENNVTARAQVQQTNSFFNSTTANSGVAVKASAGFLHTVTINFPVASATLALYDSPSTTANAIALITFPAALLNSGPVTAHYDVTLANGLWYVSTGTNFNVTISYS